MIRFIFLTLSISLFFKNTLLSGCYENKENLEQETKEHLDENGEMYNLPEELLVDIFTFLEEEDLHQTKLVSKYWNRISNHVIRVKSLKEHDLLKGLKNNAELQSRLNNLECIAPKNLRISSLAKLSSDHYVHHSVTQEALVLSNFSKKNSSPEAIGPSATTELLLLKKLYPQAFEDQHKNNIFYLQSLDNEFFLTKLSTWKFISVLTLDIKPSYLHVLSQLKKLTKLTHEVSAVTDETIVSNYKHYTILTQLEALTLNPATVAHVHIQSWEAHEIATLLACLKNLEKLKLKGFNTRHARTFNREEGNSFAPTSIDIQHLSLLKALHQLRSLTLEGTQLKTAPPTLERLKKLKGVYWAPTNTISLRSEALRQHYALHNPSSIQIPTAGGTNKASRTPPLTQLFESLPNLESLQMKIGQHSIDCSDNNWGSSSSLKKLDLSGSSLHEGDYAGIGALSTLERLRLDNCRSIPLMTPNSHKNLLKNLKNLKIFEAKHFSLSYNHPIASTEDLVAWMQADTDPGKLKMESLSLSIKGFPVNEIMYYSKFFFKKLPMLKRLTLQAFLYKDRLCCPPKHLQDIIVMQWERNSQEGGATLTRCVKRSYSIFIHPISPHGKTGYSGEDEAP